MEQSGSRFEKEKFLISGHRTWYHTCLDFLFTLFFWLYSLTVMAFILSATLGFNNTLTRVLNASFNTINQDIRDLVILAFIIFLLFYAGLYLNRFYNIKKFGSLTRRNYPEAVVNADLLALKIMDREILEKLQKENYIAFEINPIIALDGEKR